MKLKLYIQLIATLGLFLMGCSEEDRDHTLPLEERTVEIKLSLGGAMPMRAAIESDVNSNFVIDGADGNYLGVFCLAYDKRTPEVSSIDWTSSAMNAPMINVAASVKREYSGKMTTDSEGNRIAEVVSNILWNGSYYYPQGGWYKYRFYGYYPRVEENSVNMTENTLSADMTLTGYDDVVYGSTRSGESGEAFCAAYFYEHSGETPSLVLNHALARLRFRAYAGETYTGSTSASQIRVTGVTVHQVPTDYRLTIADIENPSNEGKMTRIGTGMTDVNLCDGLSNSGLGANYYLRTDHTQSNPLVIGNEVMVPTDETAYYISVTLINGKGEDCSPQGYWKIAPVGGFLPGLTYWVEMKISNNPGEATGEVTIN